MATFTVNGFEIKSWSGNEVSATRATQLQIVAPLGHATLDFRYVNDGTQSAEVSLSDYNILLDGLHLNDGVLPDRIELFNLDWSLGGTAATSRVLNLAFSDQSQWRDCIFTVGADPLPDLTDPLVTDTLLANACFSVPDGASQDNIYTLELDNMPGVTVAGVVQRLLDAEQDATQDIDEFQFSYNPDAEVPGITEFDIAARAENVDHLSPQVAEQPVIEVDVDADIFDPGVDMPSYDDLVG